MALLRHWVAADAGGAGSTLVDRVVGAVATLSAGCTWSSVGGEPTVNCPPGERLTVPDSADWDFTEFAIVVRGAFNSLSGNPGIVAHSEGTGFTNKWFYSYDAGGQALHINQAGPFEFVRGDAGLPAAGVVVGLSINRLVDAVTFRRDRTADGGGTATLAFPSIAAPLLLGDGGESYAQADFQIVSIRLYGGPESTGVLDAAMEGDATLTGAATISVSATGGLSGPMEGTADVEVSAAAALIVPKPLAGGAALAITPTGALTVPKPLAGAAALSLLTAADLAVLAGFRISLTASGPLNRPFWISLQVVQPDLQAFSISLHSQRGLPAFQVSMRSLPDLETVLADDIHRPVGRLEEA